MFEVRVVASAYAHYCLNQHGWSSSFCLPRDVNSTTTSHSCKTGGSQVWAELHEKAFRRLGGATRIVVLDNLREGVLKPDVYDPTLNPLCRDVLQHVGVYWVDGGI